MVIYNHKKEFVGIEEKDLRALKLSSLAELQNEAADFADLFVKTPGHIHNFKHVHWLDFIGSADSIDENRVIISVKGRNYKATIELRTLFLVDDPEKAAYGVVLSGIRELTKEENERISGDLAQRGITRVVEPTPEPAAPLSEAQPQEEKITTPSEEVVEDPYATKEIEEEPLTLDLDLETPAFKEEQEEIRLPEEEEALETSLDVEEETPAEESVYVSDEEDKFADYHYDPELAAKELGLPTDLVEEFIQDFIAQAHEFKPELYEALDAGRMDNLRMLSHKLKGVAANLRIEDAYDALVTINTSDDIDLVTRTLDRFYNFIIKKLAGEEVKAVSAPQTEAVEEEPTQEEAISLDLDEEITLEAPTEEETATEALKTSEEEKIELDLDEDLFAEQEESPQTAAAPQEEEKLELDLETQEDDEPLELTLDEDDEEPLELALDEDEGEESAVVADEQSADEEPLELFEEEGAVEEAVMTESIEIDKAHIASELGIDVAAYEELLGDYVSDMHGGLAQLEEAVANGDDESAKKLALRLKGMSDNMHLNTIAEEFERFIKDDEADRAALLKKIKMQIDSIEGK